MNLRVVQASEAATKLNDRLTEARWPVQFGVMTRLKVSIGAKRQIM